MPFSGIIARHRDAVPRQADPPGRQRLLDHARSRRSSAGSPSRRASTPRATSGSEGRGDRGRRTSGRRRVRARRRGVLHGRLGAEPVVRRPRPQGGKARVRVAHRPDALSGRLGVTDDSVMYSPDDVRAGAAGRGRGPPVARSRRRPRGAAGAPSLAARRCGGSAGPALVRVEQHADRDVAVARRQLVARRAPQHPERARAAPVEVAQPRPAEPLDARDPDQLAARAAGRTR